MKSYTISFDLVRNCLALQIGKGHIVSIPCNAAGMSALYRILSNGMQDEMQQTIGTSSSPTQEMVSDWLKSNSVKRPEAKKPVVLKELTDEAFAELMQDLKI